MTKSNFRLISISVTIILALSCCKKNPSNPVITPKSIVGEWRWISTYKVIPDSDTNPLTPQNTGIEEILVFNTNSTWYKTENNEIVDSGSYKLGHNKLLMSYSEFIYDSICYYKNNKPLKLSDYYEITNDTLIFSSSYAGRWWSYTLYHSGTKRWIKIK